MSLGRFAKLNTGANIPLVGLGKNFTRLIARTMYNTNSTIGTWLAKAEEVKNATELGMDLHIHDNSCKIENILSY